MSAFLKWGQRLGDPTCPYLRRWVLNLGLFSVRLHHWSRGDDDRALHDHPWWFVSLVLSGSMIDVTETGRERLTPGDVSVRPALHKHTVETRGCWTLLLCGPERRVWGFWIRHRSGAPYWVRASRYFRKAGHHPCE